MESKGRLVMLVVAGIVVAFAAIAIRGQLTDSEQPALVEKAQSNRIIVARRDVPPGTFVQLGADIDWAVMEPEQIKEGHLREGNVSLENFAGAVARRQLRAGEALTDAALTRAGEGGFMSAVLEPGMRAVTVAVTATSGNAGFISPGDRVDLIVTHRIHSKDAGGNDSVVSETFIRNVRILAVDQMLDNPENKAILAKTVTVEVTPRQAEQISVASEMGKISLTLRSLNGQKPVAGQAGAAEDLYMTRDSDISQMLGGEGISPRVRVIRGDQVENVDLY